jgi:hypothetical protein
MGTNHCGRKASALLSMLILTPAMLVMADRASADPPAPAQPQLPVVWLGSNFGTGPFDCPGQITQEIYRQALLIAARDELGLQTRDESLREWRTMSPHSSTLRILFEGPRAYLIDMANPQLALWENRYTRDMPNRYPRMIEEAEDLSRHKFVALLKQRGWAAKGVKSRPDGPAPANAEALVEQMEELPQFIALRQTHALIRTDGESLPRLGMVVRAYANLGQLTRYHWSIEYAVYSARSLIYAQRMVATHPDSAYALWHRAYAFALAGFLDAALKDLSAAAAMNKEPAPSWAVVLEAFCKYQTDKLVSLAKGDPADAPLSLYLAFVSVENSMAHAGIVSRAQAVLSVSPNCLRAIDGQFNRGGMNSLIALDKLGPERFDAALSKGLADLPDLSVQAKEKIVQNPQNRVGVCDSLLEQGAPEHDPDEPSLGAVARWIQEVSFAQLRRRAAYEAYDFMDPPLQQDVLDVIAQSQPLLKDHPFDFALLALSHVPINYDQAAARQAMTDHPWVMIRFSPITVDLALMAQDFNVQGPNGPDEAYRWLGRYTDDDSLDLDNNASQYLIAPGDYPWLIDQIKHLSSVSAHSPYLCVWNIQNHWDAESAVGWEAQYGDFPTVALALGRKYEELHRWPDSERCLKKYIAASPDKVGYYALAQLYGDEDRPDLQIATYKQCLTIPQEEYTDHAMADMKIAQAYLATGMPRTALPFADAAAQHGPLDIVDFDRFTCDALAHAGVHDWATANAIFEHVARGGSPDAFWWYSSCVHSGHGDRAAATTATLGILNQPSSSGADPDLKRAVIYLVENQGGDAVGALRRRMPSVSGPIPYTLVALIEDHLGDFADRDEDLGHACDPASKDTVAHQFAELIRKTMQAGPRTAPDRAALNSILSSADRSDREWMCVMSAMLLDQHGHGDAAKALLLKYPIINPYSVARPIADSILQRNGVNPLTVAATPPRIGK